MRYPKLLFAAVLAISTCLPLSAQAVGLQSDQGAIKTFSGANSSNKVMGAHGFIGDVNGDGYQDFAYSATKLGRNSVVVVFGAAGQVAEGTTATVTSDATRAIEYTSYQANDGFGSSISGVGDVNGDGMDDFVVLAGGYKYGGVPSSHGQGAAFLIFGKEELTGGSLTTTTDKFIAFAIPASANTTAAMAGGVVIHAGDINNDGLNDIAFSAPYFTENAFSAPTTEGAVYIVYGTSGTPAEVVTAYGGTSGDGLIVSVVAHSSVKRITGEVADLNVDPGTGIITGSGGALGISLSAAGDVDRDGCADIVIGAPYLKVGSNTIAGAGYVLYGGGSSAVCNSGALSSASYAINSLTTAGQASRFSGSSASEYAGLSVAGGGDNNNDTYPDFTIGGRLFFGQLGRLSSGLLSTGHLISTGSAIYDPRIVDNSGDVNGDGIDDLLFFQYAIGTASDQYTVLYGRSDIATQTSAASSIVFETPGADGYPALGSIGPDMNNDGYDELAISDDGTRGAVTNNGLTHLIYSVATTPALTGANLLTVECGVATTDPGASALDSYTSQSIAATVSPSSIDASFVHSFTQTYSLTNFIQRVATTNRTVNVVDRVAPVVTVSGNAAPSLTVGDVFTDSGATAADACSGSTSVSVSGSVNTAVAGTYTLTYASVDASGNRGQATRVVTVTAAPATTVGNNDPAPTTSTSDTFTADERAAQDPESSTTYDSLVTAVNAGNNGTITVTYSTGETSTFIVEADDVDGQPEVARFPGTGFLLVLSPKGKYISIINPYTGERFTKKRISSIPWAEKSLIIKDLRKNKKQDAIITLKNKKGKNNGRVIALEMKKDKKGFSKTAVIKFTSTTVKPTKTRLSAKDTIELRTSKSKRVVRFMVDKKYKLLLKQ